MSEVIRLLAHGVEYVRHDDGSWHETVIEGVTTRADKRLCEAYAALQNEHREALERLEALVAERDALVRALDDELILSGFPPMATHPDPYQAARKAVADVLSFALLIERDPAVNADLRALHAERDAALAGARDNADWARNAEHEMREAKAERDALKEQALVLFGVNTALQSERDALAHEMRGVRACETFMRGDNLHVKWDALSGAFFAETLPEMGEASLPALGHALIQEGHVDAN